MRKENRDSPDEEPPPEVDKNSLKLCISRSGDLRSVIFGCQPLLAGNNNFRSLVALGWGRRVGVLAVNKDNK